MRGRFIRFAAGLGLMLLLAACGGGDGGTSRDVNPSAPPPDPAVTGPNSFLLFPNPIMQANGSLQTDTLAYADAYYTAIDPTNARDTFAKWKAINGFDSGTGTQLQVIFGDVRDLGYGRRMTSRQNTDGTLAFYVENYLVRLGPEYAYSTVNLDAAIARDARWLIGINAIEFSPGPAGGVSFVKFYNFSPSGGRQLTVDLDGRGEKAMPGPCTNCHGGRADPLTPTDVVTGKPLFGLVQNSASLTRGDVQAHLHAFSVDTFDFSTIPGLTRADQEAALKQMNKWVLCSYPIVGAALGAEDTCRRTAIASEWVGTAADTLKQAYGGNGMPNASFVDTYVPPGWLTVGQSTLYQNVMVPACRTCHEVRGTRAQNSIDFDTYAKFVSFAERIKHHVLDLGNMPLSKLVYDRFYLTNGPSTIADFLTAQGQTSRDGLGAVLKPGRPFASLVDRVIKQGPTTLTAPSSRFATTYAWTVVSGPAGAVPPTNVTLTNATSAQPTFNATANGTYVVQLVVGNGTTLSAPATANIVVDNTLPLDPSAIRFSDIKAVFASAGCTGCHQPAGNPLPPIFFTAIDRDGRNGPVADATDDAWFYAEVYGRVNLIDTEGSKLLSKPAGKQHAGGGPFTGFNSSLAAGAVGRRNYDLFQNWILNNAPQ